MFKIISTIIVLLGCVLDSMMAGSAPTADKPAIPDDLFFEFKAIPDGENATINWRRAAQVRVPLSEKAKEMIRFCWTAGMRKPAADDLDELKIWLKRNQEALALFEASLQKPKAQWSLSNPQNPLPETLAFAPFIKARLFEADQLTEQKKYEEAARSLSGSLQLTQLGIEADGSLIHYLVAANARTLVQGAILRLASRSETPLPLMEKLLKDLPSLDAETNIYAHIVRVDFSVYDYASYDLKAIAETWSKISETNIAMINYPEELHRPLKVLLDPMLISQHPKPFDMIAEIKKDEFNYRIFRTNSFSAWTNRSLVVAKERAAGREKLLEDIQSLMELVKDEPLPLSKQAAQKARGAYLQIENPIGRLFACSQSGLAETDIRIFRFRAEREVTRTILALLIFERTKGTLPAKLSDLVEAKILTAVPIDPFADAPVSYSRERRIVWSVGEDGKNDNGNGSEFHWVGDDAVWQIPKIN